MNIELVRRFNLEGLNQHVDIIREQRATRIAQQQSKQIQIIEERFIIPALEKARDVIEKAAREGSQEVTILRVDSFQIGELNINPGLVFDSPLLNQFIAELQSQCFTVSKKSEYIRSSGSATVLPGQEDSGYMAYKVIVRMP